MNEILLNYLAQAVLGGAAGYITNDYAINMLFKEYTPLKIGGVIKKTRNEFIDNLSSMVENDIINKEKLHEILLDDNFKEKFETLTRDFFEKSIYETAGNHKFSDITGFEDSMLKTDEFVSVIINGHVSKVIDYIVDSLNAEDLVNQSQLEKISGSLYDSIINVLKETDIFQMFLLSLYNSNKYTAVNELLCGIENSSSLVISNIFEKFRDIINDDETHVDEIFDSLNLKEALKEAKEVFDSKEISMAVNINSHMKSKISKQFVDYINSEKGQENINNLCGSLFAYGKSSDKSIFDLLDSSFEESLKEYIKESLPHITKSIVLWIEKNGRLIDKLLEDSIDEVIKESDGIKGKLLSTIKNTYFSNLSQKYSIVQKIISFVEKIAEPEKLSSSISEKAIEILSNMTLREIVEEAERNNVTAQRTSNLVTAYLNTNFEEIFSQAVDNASRLQIGNIVPDYNFEDLSLRRIITSKTAVSMAEKKAAKEINKKMNLNLSQLTSEQTLKEAAQGSGNFITDMADKNNESIEKWIQQKITEAAGQKSLLKNKSVYDHASEEIYKVYKASLYKVENMDISEDLDKINSIGQLPENSSKALREYVINNTDTILKGSIKGIVSSNLNQLSDDDLVDFANEFIGRELKPIMFFGGVLGVLAGLTLAAFQNNPANPSVISAATMATYAFVGLITNVLAINMLFLPYKEIKFLKRVPFLRSFSQGFILRNQKSFAKSTASFIDKSLLSQKSINNLFNEYETTIKESFIKSAGDGNYETAGRILSDNRESIAKGLLSYGKNKISENSKNIAAVTYDKASNIKLSVLLTDKVADKLSQETVHKISSDEFKDRIYKAMNSENATTSAIPLSFVRKKLPAVTEKYYTEFENFTSDVDSIKKYALKHQVKYKQFTGRKIKDILGSDNTDKLTKATSDKISNIVLSKSSREKISQGTVRLFNKFFDRDKNFEDLFDGRLKNYIDGKMPGIMKKISITVKNSVKESKSKISTMVQTEIKNSLGFLERGMYTFMGGDMVVDELMKKVIEEKIPKFMDDKEDELNNIIKNLIDEKFYKSKVQVLHNSLDKIQINEIIDKYLESGNSAKIELNIHQIVKETIDRETDKDLNEILEIFYLNDIESIFEVYKEEIKVFFSKLNSSLSVDRHEIIEKVYDFTNELLNGISKFSLKEFLSGVSEEEANGMLSSFLEEINKNEKLQKLTADAFKEIRVHLNNLTIGDISDRDEYIKTAGRYLNELIKKDESDELIRNIILFAMDKAAVENFSFIDEETKKYILNIFVDSCILSLKNNLDHILKTVQFDQIAMEEIENMEPSKIHEMFNSFGDKYFRRLMIYGLGGFVFGINMYVGFGLAALKTGSELLRKKD